MWAVPRDRNDCLGTLFEFGTSTKGEQGNGMGLWSVKHILNKYLGRITVPSAPGQGTRFNLWWPRGEHMDGRLVA